MRKSFSIFLFIIAAQACTNNLPKRAADVCEGQFLSDVCIVGAEDVPKVIFGPDVSETTEGEQPETVESKEDTSAIVEDVEEPKDVLVTGPCTSHVDCNGEGACIDGKCQIECKKNEDCGDPGKWECKQFQCFSTVTTDPVDAGPTDLGPPPVDSGQPVQDTGGGDKKDVNPNCTEKKASYGATCFCKDDCSTGLCLGDIAAGKGFCTQECFTSDTCPGADWCYADPSGTKVCVQNDSGNSCQNGCLSGITLTNGAGACICTVPCASANGCPLNMACSAVGVNGVPTKVCVPIGQFCNSSNPSNCYGICFPDLSNTFLCTATCEGFNDCPAGYKCHQEVLNGQTYQTCLPN